MKAKRNLAVGGAVVAVAAAAGGAYAATQSGGPSRQAFVNDAAKRLNVSPQKLTSALQGAFLDQLNAAVKAGRLTQAQADAIKQRVLHGGGPPISFGEHRFGFRDHGGRLPGVATYLGLTDAQVFQQLSSGKSLAQIAQARQKSVSGLEAAMIAEARAHLDRAVSDGRLSKSQEQQILSGFSAHVKALVTRSGAPPRFFRGGPPPPAGGPAGVPGPPPPAGGPAGLPGPQPPAAPIY